jgi:pimeloyl-ACP methyl ester carboxylesterase
LAVSGVRALSRLVPRGVVPFWVGVGLDTLDQRPAAMAATLHGIFFGRLAPPAAERAAIDVPALVIGHRGDPLHPVADATMLAEELTGSELVAARSVLEWRVRPERLDAVVFAFVQECFEARTGRLLGASS